MPGSASLPLWDSIGSRWAAQPPNCKRCCLFPTSSHGDKSWRIQPIACHNSSGLFNFRFTSPVTAHVPRKEEGYSAAEERFRASDKQPFSAAVLCALPGTSTLGAAQAPCPSLRRSPARHRLSQPTSLRCPRLQPRELTAQFPGVNGAHAVATLKLLSKLRW